MSSRPRLFFSFTALVIAVLLVIGVLLGEFLKSHYRSYHDDMRFREAQMLAHFVEDLGGDRRQAEKSLNDMAESLEARILLADGSGRKIFETNNEYSAASEAMDKAMAEAFSESKPVSGQSFSANGYYFYVESVDIEEEETAFLIFATNEDSIEAAYSVIWWSLACTLGLAMAIILMIGSQIASRYTRPIDSATKVAFELAKGNYRARTYEDQNGETGMLSASINILARNLQELQKSQEIQQDRLGVLIENMGSGLILIDSKGYISLINRAYKEFFQLDTNHYLQQLYHEVIEYDEINDLIEEIFMTEKKTKKLLILPFGIERRHFQVYGVPIIGNNNVWKGVLLVFHDITELKKLEQMRKDFVANVSHELKTPVTSIKGFSETLLDGAMNDKKTLEAFLSIILKESERLQTLIQDLLELSKLEQHGFKINVVSFKLSEVVAEVVQMLSQKAKERNISLELTDKIEGVTMKGDPDRLKQVMINLINNALLYTPKGGVVKVELVDLGEQLSIKVTDTGVGLEEHEIPRIFERFYRVDKARSRDSGGTGLGLAIVKHIIEAHKGTIEVNSKVGQGSVFTVKLSKDGNRIG